MVFWPDGSRPSEPFTFTFVTIPALRFSFDQTLAAVPKQPFKRRRALSDVDGHGNEGRKKRRLRLHLITSRLSRPFSQPATNIVNRGNVRIAYWLRNRFVGRTDLRKVAIMNRVRQRLDATKDVMDKELGRRTGALALREIVAQKPRIYDLPLPPSPLGLSNYDALDLEDEMFDEDGDDVHGRSSSIYSDFNIMNPLTCDDQYEFLDALDGIQPENIQVFPPPPLEENILEILKGKEREEESYVVRYGEDF